MSVHNKDTTLCGKYKRWRTQWMFAWCIVNDKTEHFHLKIVVVIKTKLIMGIQAVICVTYYNNY